jgi:NAD(P)-dependent dehydrogenase (short-subunit alcohol dehydrogenase family)
MRVEVAVGWPAIRQNEGASMIDPRVVVVTGASAGLGRAIARAFGARGAAVALLARGQDRLAAAEREIRDAGGRALAIPTDVADAGAVSAAADRIERELGPIDVWVNNAMVSVFSPVKDMTAQEYRRVTEVTYLGYVHGTLAALHCMHSRDSGTIVQVSSALAFRAIPLQSAYCAAKHAIKGFTESLRTELLHDGSGVQVTMVHMPALNTPQFTWVRSRLPHKPQPVPPIYQPELGAEAVVYAALHPGRRDLKVGASTVRAIWGNRVAPGLLDAYLAKTGYESQQTDEPERPGRPDNLWTSLPGDYGAHGPFDAQAHSGSLQLRLEEHRGLVLLAAGVAGAAAAFAWRTRRT